MTPKTMECLIYLAVLLICGIGPAFGENMLTPGALPSFDSTEDYWAPELLSAEEQKRADDWAALLDAEDYETRIDAYDHLLAMGGKSSQHLSGIYQNWAKRPEVTSLEARIRLKKVIELAERAARWNIYRKVQAGFARAMKRPEGQCFVACDPELEKRLRVEFKPQLAYAPLAQTLLDLSQQAGVTIVADPEYRFETEHGNYLPPEFHGNLLQFLEQSSQLMGLRVIKFGKAIVLAESFRMANWYNLIGTYSLPSRNSEKWTEDETLKVCALFSKYGQIQNLPWSSLEVREPGKLTLLAPAEQQKEFSDLITSLTQPRCPPDEALAFSGFKTRELYRTISFETQKRDLPDEFRQLKTLTGLNLSLEGDFHEYECALLDVWKVNDECLEQVLLQFCKRWNLRIYPTENGWMLTRRYALPSQSIIAIDYPSALNAVTISEDTRKELMNRVACEANGDTEFCEQVYHGYWFGITDPWSEVRIRTYVKLLVHGTREGRDLDAVTAPPKAWFMVLR